MTALELAARTLGLYLRRWPAPASEACWAVYDVGDLFVGCVEWRSGELRAERTRWTRRAQGALLDSLVSTARSIAPASGT